MYKGQVSATLELTGKSTGFMTLEVGLQVTQLLQFVRERGTYTQFSPCKDSEDDCQW